jgi:hypothetical protein
LYDRFYGPGRHWLAGGIVRLGMRAEVRRARAAAARGEISAAELTERVSAAREVTDMVVRSHG